MMSGMTNFGGMGSWYLGFGFLWQIIWLAIIVAVIYFLVTSLTSNRKKDDRSLQILKERLARGEISEEEYSKLRDALLRS